MQVDNKQIVILIADDNEANLLLLDTVLKSEQYQVVQARDGLEALVKAKEAKPDLIILDIMMPNLDGFETCQRLKKGKDTCNIPIVFLSAKNKHEDVIQGLELGAVDYMTKPFNRVELLLRIRTQIELKCSRDNLSRLATMDNLTGLLNHGGIQERLRIEISHALRRKAMLSVAILGIDNFKEVNHQHGFKSGDELLQKMAAYIRENMPESAILGRYGGDEFLILLPKYDAEAAYGMTENLRQAIKNETWLDNGADITLSGAVAAWHDENLFKLIDLLAERLACIKQAGRDQVYAEDRLTWLEEQ